MASNGANNENGKERTPQLAKVFPLTYLAEQFRRWARFPNGETPVFLFSKNKSSIHPAARTKTGTMPFRFTSSSPTPSKMPNRTHLRAANPFALGVHIVAVNPLRRLHDARSIEVAARAVDQFPARNHGAGIIPTIMETPLVKYLRRKNARRS